MAEWRSSAGEEEAAACWSTALGSMPGLPLGDVNPANPVVFLEIAVGGEPMGKLAVELKADAVPKTAENCRPTVEFKESIQFSEIRSLVSGLATETPF